MKRSTIFVGMLLSAVSAMAQTETAKTLYKEATANRAQIEHFLKRDFSDVDSTSMHDLAVMLYRDKDYRSAGRCWEIALQKVKKHGKAYEQILNAMSSAYTELEDADKIQMVMELMEEHNQHELTLPCNDYKCKLERAQYYIMHGDESKAREHIQESLKLCQTEEQRIEVEEAYAKILFDVRDFLSCAQYYLSASNRWKKLGTNPVHMGTDMYWAAQNYMLASQYDKAETCSRDAIAYFKRQKDDTEKKFYLMSVLSLGDALFCQQKLLLSAKTQNSIEPLSAMPINRRCGHFFEKVSPLSQIRSVQEALPLLLQASSPSLFLVLQGMYSSSHNT